MMFIANIVATGYSLSVEKERRVVLKASGVYRRSEIGDLLRSVACACLFSRGEELKSLQPFEEDRLTTADSGQRSRRIGHLSRVFPPRDVLSSLSPLG